MDDRQKIVERLRKKELEVQALEERVRTARTYVQALQDILKLLDGDSSKASVPPAVPGEAVLRSGSAVARARQAILDRARPVHISALLDALGREKSRESAASLASSLAAYVRRGEIFTRPAPNTFGLVELGHTSSAGTDDDNLPPGFGLMQPIAAQQPRTAPPPPSTSKLASASKSPPPSIGEPTEEIDDDIPF